MSTLAMALLLTSAGQTQPAPPAASPPAISVFHAPHTMPVPERIFGLMPIVTSAPVPMPRSVRPARRATAILRHYFSEDDYPARATRDLHEGTVGFRLDVNPEGRVATCTVTSSSSSPALDAATCRILRARARFVPALMADGSAAPDAVRGSVRWRLREDQGRAGVPLTSQGAWLLTRYAGSVTAGDYPRGAPPYTPRGSRLRVAIGRDGRVIGCEVVAGSGSAQLDAAACPLYAARARYAPARDAAGAAVCDVAWDVVWWNSARLDLPPQPPVRGPAARLPGPLRAQLRTRRCPGWRPD